MTSYIFTHQLQEVCSLLALDTEFIDWRRFLLAAAQPWPPASKMDLLLTLEHCREVDATLSGSLTQQQFEQVCIRPTVVYLRVIFATT